MPLLHRRQRVINEPTAVLEFSVGAAVRPSSATQMARLGATHRLNDCSQGSTQTFLHCEADRAAVAGVLDSIQAIQQCIANVKGT